MKTLIKTNNAAGSYKTPEVSVLDFISSAVLCASNACTLDFDEVEFEGFNAWE